MKKRSLPPLFFNSFIRHRSDKPGYVIMHAARRMIIYLGLSLPTASSDLPESRSGKPVALCLVLLRMGFTCALLVTSEAVVSYTTFPPLPCWRYISVALALESPLPDVIRHPALWSPDFPHLLHLRKSRDHLPQWRFYYIIIRFRFQVFYSGSYTLKQLPPTNSLIIELFGSASVLTPKK